LEVAAHLITLSSELLDHGIVVCLIYILAARLHRANVASLARERLILGGCGSRVAQAAGAISGTGGRSRTASRV
jgi:hypothetical protein